VKFNRLASKVVIKRIYLSSGKLGERTPMVEFDPVSIDDRDFTNAAFNTLDDLRNFYLGVGDEAILVIAGDVIPKLSHDETCKKTGSPKVYKFDYCPTCYTDFHGTDKQYICTNPACKDNIIGRFTNFFEKIGIEFGSSVAEDIYKITKSPKISDILKVTADDLKAYGYDKKGKEFVKEFRKKISDLKDYELLGAMGIASLQKKKAIIVLQAIPLEKLLKASYAEIYQTLCNLPGFGPASAAKIGKSIHDSNSDTAALFKMLNAPEVDYSTMKTVGFTGLVSDDKLDTLIRKIGFSSTNSKKFDILITSSHDRDSKKSDYAKEKNLPIYTREDFIKEYDKE